MTQRNSSVDRMELNGGEILSHAIDHLFNSFDADNNAQSQIDAHRLMVSIEREISRESLRQVAKNWMDVCRANYVRRSA